jgi:lipopolysaccharide/colanic/teichoic acid biosynthesis glycosyltransferase
MSIFPIVLDSKPEYLRGDGALSLLQLPVGSGTLLQFLARQLTPEARRAPIVVRTFEAGQAYSDTLRATGAIQERCLSLQEMAGRIRAFEPSDWLLFVDPRTLPVNGLLPAPLLSGLGDTPRLTRHLIALDTSAAGTNELVEFDAEQRVRRVQRYYDAVTWTLVRGVSCSMVPVSVIVRTGAFPFSSLIELRRSLVESTAPSRDVPIVGSVLDLTTERGLLALNDHVVREAATGDGAGVRGTIHPRARVVGPVVVQAGSVVEEQATIVGPAVVGAGARIQRGAVVAQAVVAAGTVVPAAAAVRHCIVNGDVAATLRSVPLDTDETEIEIDDGLRQVEQRRMYAAVKAWIEPLFALTALIILSPILLLISVLVKLDSVGPVFYGDPRESKGGSLFRCLKFRTMRMDADVAQRELAAANQMDGPQFKIDHDPRVTRLGRWLRSTSLDELPQLINVAMGQMSLVGPRPSPFRENQTCVPWREARLSVRPGITGLWQVCRHERKAGDFHQWIYYDIQYIRNVSFWVDLKIVAATIWTLGGKSHVPLSWIVPSSSVEKA